MGREVTGAFLPQGARNGPLTHQTSWSAPLAANSRFVAAGPRVAEQAGSRLNAWRLPMALQIV